MQDRSGVLGAVALARLAIGRARGHPTGGRADAHADRPGGRADAHADRPGGRGGSGADRSQNITPARRITLAYGENSPVRTTARASRVIALSCWCDSVETGVW